MTPEFSITRNPDDDVSVDTYDLSTYKVPSIESLVQIPKIKSSVQIPKVTYRKNDTDERIKTLESIIGPKNLGEEKLKSIIHLWEGRVLSVDTKDNCMNALLVSETDNMEDHKATFSLEWVPDQDIDLVIPGAIFYLIMYKEKYRGTIKNSQELLFQRLPKWSHSQISQISNKSKILFSKFNLNKLPND